MNNSELSTEWGDGSGAGADDPNLADSEKACTEAVCDIGVFGLATMGANLARNATR